MFKTFSYSTDFLCFAHYCTVAQSEQCVKHFFIAYTCPNLTTTISQNIFLSCRPAKVYAKPPIFSLVLQRPHWIVILRINQLPISSSNCAFIPTQYLHHLRSTLTVGETLNLPIPSDPKGRRNIVDFKRVLYIFTCQVSIDRYCVGVHFTKMF